MALSYTWDTTFNNGPLGSATASTLDTIVNNNRKYIRERVEVEHNFDLSDNDNQGSHKAGSAVAYYQSATPTNRPDGSTSLDGDDYGRLWIDSDTDVVKMRDSSGWSDLSIGGNSSTATNADLADDATIAQRLGTASTYSGERRVFQATTITEGNLFDDMEDYIPVTGDAMMVSGSINDDEIVSYVIRNSSTQLTIWGRSTSGVSIQQTVRDGNSSTITHPNIAW